MVCSMGELAVPFIAAVHKEAIAFWCFEVLHTAYLLVYTFRSGIVGLNKPSVFSKPFTCEWLRCPKRSHPGRNEMSRVFLQRFMSLTRRNFQHSGEGLT